MEEKGAAYYNKLFKEHTDMSRYEDIYKKIGEMTQKTVDIGCGLAELRKHIKSYKGFDFSKVAIKGKKECFLGDVYDKKNYEGKVFTCTEVLEHVDDLRVIRNIPDGARLIFTVPSFTDPSHLRTYTENDINLPGLEIKSVERFNWHDKWTKGEDTDNYILLVDAVKRPVTISVSMIVKNEEKMLRAALESVKWADEIIIVDTGSTDRTEEIAKEYGKVYHQKWADNFAKARNYSLSKCTGDWILIIDADEVLDSPEEMVRHAIENNKGGDTLEITTNSGKESLWSTRIFKRGEIRWKGKAHNYLVNVKKRVRTEIKLTYGYSPAHQEDPDRTLRILKKAAEDGPREKFYLAREYMYRKDYDNALKWYTEYLKKATFKAEICDAYLQMANCKWSQRKGQEARNYCLKAIEGNPNFKEALLLMAEMSWEAQGKAWKKFAEIANNEDVLFKREQ